MKVQVNSDKNISVDARVMQFVRGQVNRTLGRFKGKLTRVEVHLSDVNSHKFGKHDKRCAVEARAVGRRPVAATMAAPRVDAAVRGSLSKLQRVLDTSFARTIRTSDGATRTRRRPTALATARKKTATVAARPARKSAAKKTAARRKKTSIYQARRKSWPKVSTGR